MRARKENYGDSNAPKKILTPVERNPVLFARRRLTAAMAGSLPTSRLAVACLLFLLTSCTTHRVPRVEVRTVDVRIVSELSDERTKDILGVARAYLRDAGVSVREVDDCVGCVHIGIKSKQVWRYLIGYQGWYSPEANTIMLYAGLSDRYAGKILAHEIGHALGCPHELRGLMHNPLITSPVMWPFDGVDFATGYSDACVEIMHNSQFANRETEG